MPCLAPDGRYVLDRLECLAFLQMPFNPEQVSRPSVPRPYVRRAGGHLLAAHLCEDLGKERCTSENGGLLALAEEERFPQIFAHHIAAVIEGGRVLREPGGHLGLPAWREQVFVLVFGHASTKGTYLSGGVSFGDSFGLSGQDMSAIALSANRAVSQGSSLYLDVVRKAGVCFRPNYDRT